MILTQGIETEKDGRDWLTAVSKVPWQSTARRLRNLIVEFQHGPKLGPLHILRWSDDTSAVVSPCLLPLVQRPKWAHRLSAEAGCRSRLQTDDEQAMIPHVSRYQDFNMALVQDSCSLVGR